MLLQEEYYNKTSTLTTITILAPSFLAIFSKKSLHPKRGLKKTMYTCLVVREDNIRPALELARDQINNNSSCSKTTNTPSFFFTDVEVVKMSK